MATLREIYDRLLAMTGAGPAGRGQGSMPGGPPETRRFRLPFVRRPKAPRQTEIPPEQLPGGGAPHR